MEQETKKRVEHQQMRSVLNMIPQTGSFKGLYNNGGLVIKDG